MALNIGREITARQKLPMELGERRFGADPRRFTDLAFARRAGPSLPRPEHGRPGRRPQAARSGACVGPTRPRRNAIAGCSGTTTQGHGSLHDATVRRSARIRPGANNREPVASEPHGPAFNDDARIILSSERKVSEILPPASPVGACS